MHILNDINKKKKERYRLLMDRRGCQIKEMEEIPEIKFGEVKSVGARTYLAFIIRNGKIEFSDLLSRRDQQFSFTYSLTSGEYRGKGTVNHFRECEMYVYFVLLLLESLNQKD